MIAFLLSIALALVNFIADEVLRKTAHRTKYISFASGAGMVYVCLQLLPEAFLYAGPDQAIFISLLAGFVSYHIAEKFAYQHSDKKALHPRLHHLHLGMFTAYHAIIGLLLVHLVAMSIKAGLLFALSIALVLLLTSAVLKSLTLKFRHDSKLCEIMLALSFPAGTLLGFIIPLSPLIFSLLFAFLGAGLMYIIIREMIPEKQAGEPLYFLLGVLFYCAFLYLLQLV